MPDPMLDKGWTKLRARGGRRLSRRRRKLGVNESAFDAWSPTVYELMATLDCEIVALRGRYSLFGIAPTVGHRRACPGAFAESRISVARTPWRGPTSGWRIRPGRRTRFSSWETTLPCPPARAGDGSGASVRCAPNCQRAALRDPSADGFGAGAAPNPDRVGGWWLRVWRRWRTVAACVVRRW